MSAKLITPVSESVSELASSTISPTALVVAVVMVGPSLLPWTVTTTVSLMAPPLPSLMVTVNDSEEVSPSARYWAEVLGRL